MQTLGVRSLALAFGCVVYMQPMHNMGKVKGGRKHLCSWEWGEVEQQMREYRKKLIIFICGHHLFFPFLYIKYCLLHCIQLGSRLISLLFYNNCIGILFPISWFGLIFWYLHWHLRLLLFWHLISDLVTPNFLAQLSLNHPSIVRNVALVILRSCVVSCTPDLWLTLPESLSLSTLFLGHTCL